MYVRVLFSPTYGVKFIDWLLKRCTPGVLPVGIVARRQGYSLRSPYSWADDGRWCPPPTDCAVCGVVIRCIVLPQFPASRHIHHSRRDCRYHTPFFSAVVPISVSCPAPAGPLLGSSHSPIQPTFSLLLFSEVVCYACAVAALLLLEEVPLEIWLDSPLRLDFIFLRSKSRLSIRKID